ncbi:MAG: carbohydrate ABC transporter permease, partial [Brachybacterium tyrofermentans]
MNPTTTRPGAEHTDRPADVTASGRRRGGRSARSSGRPRSSEGRGYSALHHIILSIWALLVILPLLWTVYTSFKTSQEVLTDPFGLPAEPQLENYSRAWTEAKIGQYFAN